MWLNSQSSSLGCFTITFSSDGAQSISAQLPKNFELKDFVQVIKETISTTAVQDCRFSSGTVELKLNDPMYFQTQKCLITDGSTIFVENTSGKQNVSLMMYDSEMGTD